MQNQQNLMKQFRDNGQKALFWRQKSKYFEAFLLPFWDIWEDAYNKRTIVEKYKAPTSEEILEDLVTTLIEEEQFPKYMKKLFLTQM